jgi:hypothetical protein
VLIQDEQVPEIVAAISAWAGTVSRAQRGQHVARLQEKHGAVSAASDAPACPKCGQSDGAADEEEWGGAVLGLLDLPALPRYP